MKKGDLKYPDRDFLNRKEKLQEGLIKAFKSYVIYTSQPAEHQYTMTKSYLKDEIDKLDKELAELKEEEKDPNVVCDQYHMRGKWIKEEEPKQSAEEFLKSKCLFTYAEIELITPLLEEYRQQGMREELIKYERYLHGLDADKICELSTTDIIDEYLNKWKGE